jgi:hypothetical protein
MVSTEESSPISPSSKAIRNKTEKWNIMGDKIIP